MQATAARPATPDLEQPIPRKPLRVLHVLGSLGHGGVEMWLIHLLRAFDPRRVQMDFVIHDEHLGGLATEALARGAEVYTCPYTRNPLRYRRKLIRLLRENGPFDAVHSHVFRYSGWVLAAAAEAGVETRIAHGHSDRTQHEAGSSLRRKLYLWLMAQALSRYATHGFAVSEGAANSLFGGGWKRRDDREILPPAIDLAPFETAYGDQDARFEFGFTAAHQVIGHVGRFSEPKNHAFLLDVAETVIRHRPAARFLLVGDGPLRAKIEADCRNRGLANFVAFGGVRDDIARLMTGVMDAFVFPSLWEGLPIAVIEAQAAGLGIVGSEAVPDAAVVMPRLVTRMSLDAGAARWSDALLHVLDSDKRAYRSLALDALKRSPFAIEHNSALLEAVYLDGRLRARGLG